jgi:hypothetical protein
MKHIFKFSIITLLATAVVFAGCKKDEDNKYTITLSSNNPEMGVVAGGGEYDEGTEIQIMATANNGYHFEKWSDGDTNNPRTINVAKNVALIAVFSKNAEKYTVALSVNNSEMGIVAGGGEYDEGTEIQIAATANVGYHFEMWNDKDTNNPRTITVNKTMALIAIFYYGDVKMGEVGEVCEYADKIESCDISKVLLCSDLETEEVYYKSNGIKYTDVNRLIDDLCPVAKGNDIVIINKQLSGQTKKLIDGIRSNALQMCR